ncbi:hypothetical protein KIW84_012046 [Lathyrus oleraceus]|uniref:Response regulatory domain-containing protein n=1 Tax=Pisum sativum TaxID=3888 RepID=A0A9D5BGH2_PEA|nr:hypothetical protein KIW84_012046 [Pisum sativum]
MNCENFDITVLIVDHDAVSLALIANLLMAWKSKVQTAKDADQALTILQGSKGLFDIIISEFNLIGINGFDFLKLIQNEFHIPVIKVVPKKILKIMNVPNLTRENVASHLQKYRKFLRDIDEKGMTGGISQRVLSSSSISFSSYGEGQGWMSSPTTSSSSFLTRDLNFNDMNLVNKLSKGGDEIEIAPQTENMSINSNESSKKLQGNNGFSKEGSSKESTSTNDLEFDMDVIEALFGTIED